MFVKNLVNQEGSEDGGTTLLALNMESSECNQAIILSISLSAILINLGMYIGT